MVLVNKKYIVFNETTKKVCVSGERHIFNKLDAIKTGKLFKSAFPDQTYLILEVTSEYPVLNETYAVVEGMPNV